MNTTSYTFAYQTGQKPKSRTRAVFAALRRAKQNRRDYAKLRAMDDRLLDDMGLTRTDIEHVCRGPFGKYFP